MMSLSIIAVGLPVTRQPPHKSRRAELPHRAFQKYSHPQKALSQTEGNFRQSTFRATYDMWVCNAKLFHQLLEANPIVTLALATPI